MKGSTHNIMTMACEDSNSAPVLPVPNPDSLVITGGANPWQLFVELYCSNIVEMASESEETLLGLVVPHFHHMIISTTDKQRLSFMEVDSSYGTYNKNQIWLCYHHDLQTSPATLLLCNRKG